MIVVGAKGLAKEVLQILEKSSINSELSFFDDINFHSQKKLFNQFPILTTDKEVIEHFEKDNRFILGLGNPKLRIKLFERFHKIGGRITSSIDNNVTIGKYTKIGEGFIGMSGLKVSNGVTIGKGVLAYYNVIITHDVILGDFVELSPGAKILGRAIIEDLVHIGAGAIILPDINVGKGSVIGAGAVVTKNVKPNTIVIGNPAKEMINKRNE